MQVATREVDVSLGSGDNNSIGTGHTSSEILSDGAAAIAETELLCANADDCTVVGARCAGPIDRSGAVRVVLGWRVRSSRLSRGWARFGRRCG